MVEETHQHHHRPRHHGGTNAWDNLVILHLYCHQQTHSDIRWHTKQKERPDE
jgi:hypothetical protein